MAYDHGENFFSDGRDAHRPASRTQLEQQVEDRADQEMARRRAEFAELQRRHRQQMDDLVAKKSSMFGRTPPEVTVNALTLAIEEAHHQAKLRAAEGKPDEHVRDIRLFQPKIQGKEVAFHAEGRDGKPSFIDDGKNIFVPAYDDDIALLASLQLAQMRWGVVKVSGNDDFKDRVVQLAADYDLKLANEDLALRVHQRRSSPGTLSAPTERELEAAQKFQAELDQKPEAAEPKSAGAAPVSNAPVAAAAPSEDQEDAVIEEDAPEQAKASEAERFEMRDPLMDTTYRFESAEAATAKADELGSTRFQHVQTDGALKQVNKVDGSWVRDDGKPLDEALDRRQELSAEAVAPADSKAWIAELQEERRRKAAERAADAAQTAPAVKGSTMPSGEYDRAVEAEIKQLKAKGQSSEPQRAVQAVKERDMPEEPIEIDEHDEEPDLGYDDDEEFSVDVPSASTVTPDAKKTAGVVVRP